MLLGYTSILLAALCWGSSAILAKHFANQGSANALLLSQARVTFSWLLIFLVMVTTRPALLRITLRDFGRFTLLGLIGVSGANFLLYFAIGRMSAAVADLIQFTAPLIVAVYMYLRGREPMDTAKVIALVFALIGSALALGLAGAAVKIPLLPALSAFASALCYAFLIVFGKGLSSRYSVWTFLHYGLLVASTFWMFINPPWRFVAQLQTPERWMILIGFAVLSILLPYIFFFNGLKRVPASRAGIVSTFEPVVIAIGAWLFLGDRLSLSQVLGVSLVLAAIVLVETTSPRPPVTTEVDDTPSPALPGPH